MAGEAAGQLASEGAAALVIREAVGLVQLLRRGPLDTDSSVTLDSRLEADLGFDSLAVAELLVRIEDAADRRLPDRVLAQADTLGDLARELAGAVGSRPATGSASRASVQPGSVQPGSVHPAQEAHAEDAARSVTDGAVLPRPPGLARPSAWGLFAQFAFAAAAVIGWTLVAVLPRRATRWRVVRAAGRMLFAVTATHLRVDGADRLPTGGAVVVANHASFVDPLVLAMILPTDVTFTAVDGLSGHPAVALFLRRLGVELLPHGPHARRRALIETEVLTRLAREGRPVVLFPEGRRSLGPGVDPLRSGAFVIAARAGVPVVPVAIRGTRQILPVGARWPSHGPVEVEVGRAVWPSSASFAAAVDVRDQVHGWLVSRSR